MRKTEKKFKKDTTIKQLSKYRFLRAAILCIILGAFIWGIGIPIDITSNSREAFSSVNQNWTQIVDGKEIALEELSDFIPVDTSEWIILEHIVEPNMIGKNLVFYVEHQEVSITVDNKTLYTLDTPQSLATFGSPGRTWVQAYISHNLLGHVLQVKIRSDFSIFNGGPTDIYSLTASEIYFVQRDFLLVNNIIALIVLFLAIITYINAYIWRHHMLRKYLLAIADFYLFVAAWIFSEISVLSIWSGRTVLSSVMAMIFIRIIPIVFYHYFISHLSYSSWRTKMIAILVWGGCIGVLVAQFFFGISLLHSLLVQVVVVALGSILILMELIHYYKTMRKYDEYNKTLYFTAIIPIAALAEGYVSSHYLLRRQFLGMPLAVACIIYAMIVHVILVRTESRTKTKKNHLESEYNNLHKKPLNQQINAHFLYNSLNTISAYCKTNPSLADKMVRLVAKYMRSYMKYIGACEYITLEEELRLTQNYMDIQNLRFENKIDFHIDSSCDMVLFPPLALQPLVENAVNHGLKDKWYCGEIRILAYYKHNYAEIIVTDNGQGFDTQDLKADEGVGLKNLEARLNAMGGGIRVDSEIKKGTTVTLWVPATNLPEENPDDF